MKTTLKTVLFLFAIAFVTPSFASESTEVPTTVTAEQRVKQLENRLEEIHAMDMNKLSRSEKRALRTEVKTIKKEMKAISGGVYLSVGAIILIVLLIILLA
jgi:predicted PurR-regulated permease PerM